MMVENVPRATRSGKGQLPSRGVLRNPGMEEWWVANDDDFL
jgi:hypothetical protein